MDSSRFLRLGNEPFTLKIAEIVENLVGVVYKEACRVGFVVTGHCKTIYSV